MENPVFEVVKNTADCSYHSLSLAVMKAVLPPTAGGAAAFHSVQGCTFSLSFNFGKSCVVFLH